MKKLLKFIKLIISLLVVGVIILLVVNKTFFYTTYKDDNMTGKGIPLKRFNYFIDDNNGNISFITPLSNSTLSDDKNDYLSKLESCYGIYYYDKDNNITITKYDIKDKKYYRKLNISYVNKNYCSKDYILSDIWIYEYDEKGVYVSGDITEKGMLHLIGKVYESKRVDEPIVSDYKSKKVLKVNCYANDVYYSLEFSDFKEDELLVKKITDENVEIAIYKIIDVVSFLETLAN